MNTDNLCMGCMAEKSSAPLCPHCGWEEGTPQESSQQLPPRTLLNNRYYIGRVLGQGGFGITYLGIDTYLDIKLAIKEYFPRELVSRETGTQQVSIHSGTYEDQYNYALEKFLLEARTLARFEGHPNIISVRDFFKTNGTAYLVMVYLEGTTLKNYLDHRGLALSYPDALAIMIPVLDALRAIHAEGVLHRDISPDNIFITRTGRVVLIDFGAARQAIGEREKHLSVVLKPGYAPEEQYRSRGSQGPWTDIYAVAATFYRSITGRMPPESLDRLESDSLVPPGQLGVEIEAGEELVLLKALAVRAENRYQSVVEFQEALWAIGFSEYASGKREETTWSEAGLSPAQREETQAHAATGIPYESFQGTAEDPAYLQELPPVTPQNQYPSPVPWQQMPPALGIRIGRAPDNNIVLEDATVSRYHALIYPRLDRWYIADRGSTHGTFVDGKQVAEEQELIPGSTIQLSGAKLYFDGRCLFSEQGELLHTLTELLSSTAHKGEQGNRLAAAAPGHPSRSQSPRRKVFLFIAGLLVFLVLALAVVLSRGDGTSLPETPGKVYFNAAHGEDSEVTGTAGDTRHDALINGSSEEKGTVFGTIDFNGGVYTGELRNGMPHGYGTLVYPQQILPGKIQHGDRKYEGEWKDGRKHGEGTMSYPEGMVRKGIWENDVFTGR